MLLFGTKPIQRELPAERQVCPTCLSVTEHTVVENDLRFTLYFIPLFSVRHEVVYTCAQCRESHVVPYAEYLSAHPGQVSGGDVSPSSGKKAKSKRAKARVVLQGKMVGDEIWTSLPLSASFNSANILKWLYLVLIVIAIAAAVTVAVLYVSSAH